MSQIYDPLKTDEKEGIFQKILSFLGRTFISISIPLVAFVVLYIGFIFLRDSGAPKMLITIVAIIWGVGGVAALFFSLNWFIKRLNLKWKRRLVPFLFVGPALVILTWYLFLPTVRTLYLSFFDKYASSVDFIKQITEHFTGLENYFFCFTDRTMLTAFLNNLVWLVVGTGLCIFFGLLLAILTDKSAFERTAKSLIFLPMAISFVGAGIIWKFVYAFKPAIEGVQQIGLLNSIITSMGLDPVQWLTIRPWNTLFLIIIFVWLETGFAMIIFSAAIKQVPISMIESARLDGANEFQITLKILIPSIKSTIVTVGTTILLLTLKIFDIVFAMTNGLFGTEVLASQQYKQAFKFLHSGRGAAVAIIILVGVIPVMIYNLKQFNKREVFK
jgi:alpha-glucoside transport system permease protein